MRDNRSFAKKAELIIIGILLAAALIASAFIFLPGFGKNQYNIARVTLDGKEIMQIDLAGDDTVYDLYPDYGVPVRFELKDHQIRYVDVDCPDHLCEKEGFISKELEYAICMPNKVAVMIYTREEIGG